MVALTVPKSPELGRFPIIDDSNYLQHARDPSTRSLRGYAGRDYGKNPYGSMPWGAVPFKTIPQSEWRDRIEEGHAKKTFPIYHQLRKKVPIKNQKRTNYCWINSVTGCVQSMRAINGLPTVALSSASAGAPGKRYQNVGGWTGEAIGYINEYHLAPESMWPNDAIDPKYFEGTRDEAKKYGVGSWAELRPRNFAELMTCLLLGFPVAVGLMWWGHSVFYSAPVWDNGYGVIADNSWDETWGNKGRTVLMEDKANADEANVIMSSIFDGDDEAIDRMRKFRESLQLSQAA